MIFWHVLFETDRVVVIVELYFSKVGAATPGKARSRIKVLGGLYRQLSVPRLKERPAACNPGIMAHPDPEAL